MSGARRLLGARGEAAAAEFLTRRGYRILTRNFRCALGEIDLVAEEGGHLVFVEVKTRRGARAGGGEEAVTALKRLRMMRLAQYYAAAHGGAERRTRFDVVTVRVRAGRATLSLIRHAFEVTDVRRFFMPPR